MPNLLVIAIGAGVLLYGVLAFNRLVSLRYRVREAWAQIDVQLKRRFDLIPNVVSAVKGYMQHERSVLEDVARARQQVVAAGDNIGARAIAETTLGSAMRGLLAVAEAYPELRASENIMALQEELGTTENRIAFARQFYNDCVMEYNTAKGTFPRNLLASAFGFRPAAMFELEDFSQRAAPKVQI
jgi:LemA protein